jgi:hypothetical protein
MYVAMITLTLIAVTIIGMIATMGQQTVYADNIPKIDFLITVRNIEHKDVLVSVTVIGLTKNFTIDGNPNYVAAPTTQIVNFSFPREIDSANLITLRTGDEYTPCISFKNSEASCLSAKIDSLTVPQAKPLDVKYIPS